MELNFSPLIQADELQYLLQQKLEEQNPHLKILDARFDLANPQYGKNAFLIARIPTAQFFDLEMDLCTEKTGQNGRHPLKSQEELLELFKNAGIHNEDHIIVYDDKSGMFASHLWWILKHLGLEKVQVLNGGLDAWKKLNKDLETSMPATDFPSGNISFRENDFELLLIDEVLDKIQENLAKNALEASHNLPKIQVIDARGNARFNGEVEPLDPIAGHIPSAINYPFENNLNEGGYFKSKEDIKKDWLEFLGETPIELIVNQCGSGVSACHNLFSLYYAGLGATKLYHGSWSEWCADPSRPMITKAD
ncbi:sulfurtransferase [Ignatzschineria sp. LJL83]